ncbi:TPA: MBL fold metallo-hydrolase [bacterium]|nr:MBL fold metallo-hydrolase [bacterium]
MIIRSLALGLMQANCYLLECEKTNSAVVIDPGGDTEEILNLIKKGNLELKAIINTHGHIDHIASNNDLKKNSSAKLYIHKADADMITNPQKNLSFFIGEPFISVSADILLKDGDIIDIGEISLKVRHTPGHSPGSICLIADGVIFTGDLLFAGSIGRYDFPGSSYDQIMLSLKMIMELDNDIIVYSGHGPKTTIGEEKKNNPFLQSEI